MILTKVNSALKLQPNGKSKRGKAKYPSARDFAKKQPKVRKTEKGNGKDYGWLDFLGLPKMKLPDFLGFNSEKQKAVEASKAAQQGKQVFAQSVFTFLYSSFLSSYKQHPNVLPRVFVGKEES